MNSNPHGGSEPATAQSEADEAFKAAEELYSQGNFRDAVRKYTEVLQRDPEHAQALFKLALIAFQSGHSQRSVDFLQRAIEIDPRNFDYEFQLGFVLQEQKELTKALRCFERVVELHPRHGRALLKIGNIQLALEQREAAAMAFQRALLIEPALRTAMDNPKLPSATRKEIRTANKLLAAKHRSLAQETLDALQRYPAEQCQRIDTAFRYLTGDEQKRYSHPQQRPEYLLFPNMPARPWYEREEFDWVARVEAAYPEIKEEYVNLVREQAEFVPYIQPSREDMETITTPGGTDFTSLLNSPEWTAFHLNKAGRIEQNCARCPKTAAIMDSLPLAEAAAYMPEVFFSVLQPDAHIIPHHGQMNIRLTAHLGLIIPNGCSIRAGDEIRSWAEGKILVFDDSFEHEAWNRGDSDRIVLIFEVWNPDLNEAEIEGLQHFFKTRHDWLQKCSP